MADRPGRGRGRGVRRDKSAVRPGGNESSDDASSVTSTTTTATRPSRSESAAPAPAPNVAPTTTTASKPVGKESSAAASSAASATTTTTKSDASSESDFSDTLPKRGPFGSIGRPIQLRCNHFVVTMSNCPQLVWQYRVDITNEYNRKLKREDFYEIFWTTISKENLTDDIYTVVYDGGNICYTLNPFKIANPGKDGRAIFSAKFDRGDYKVTFLPTGSQRISFEDHKEYRGSMAVLDLTFRQLYNRPPTPNQPKKFLPWGNSFFSPANPHDSAVELGGGRHIWSGYFFGVKLGVGRIPLINIDIANSAFYKKQSMLQFMCDIFNQEAGNTKFLVAQLEALTAPFYLNNSQMRLLSGAVKGLSITTMTHRRPQRVFGVSSGPAESTTFSWKQPDGLTRDITVADYFAQKYHKLRFPFLPCLEIGRKTRPALVPFEVCEIQPQRVTGRLSEQQTSTMIKAVCTDAVTREARILDVIRRSEIGQDPFARKFGFEIKPQMMECTGRVLPPPELCLASNQPIHPRDGSWNMGHSKFFLSANLTCYGLLSFISKRAESELGNFCHMLWDTGKRMGMRVDDVNPTAFRYIDDHSQVRKGLDEIVQECLAKGKKCDIILVLMFAKNIDQYATVKSLAEREFGVLTQCVIQRNIRQPKPMTCANIALKLNAKLGGINWKLNANEITKKYLINQGTLVLGIDVTHPSPGDRNAPSIGAAVGNIDTLPAKFAASLHVQRHRREAVVYLSDALQRRVSDFYQQTQRKPERIIVYRDGVAESQFKEVLKEEVNGILLACRNACGVDFKPKITFIIVQKRHHTRFFCRNQSDMCGKAKNVQPGTVVDNIVTHPSQFDFYLCSHFGIQGTSRPAHYHVLKNDNEFTSDELQAITYHICHMYARCTRPVSIPAPTYYAHLACNRARQYLKEIIGDASSDTRSISSEPRATYEEDIKKAVTIAESLTSKMFFC